MLLSFQLDIIKWLQDNGSALWDSIWSTITTLGESYFAIVIIALIYWVLDKKLGQKFVYIIAGSQVINGTIKGLVKAPRPFQNTESYDIINKRPSTATGYSFPSGHTQSVSTIMGFIAWHVKKYWLTILSVILIIAVAVSRMYLGAHYPVDVLVGGILGVVLAIFGSILYDKQKDPKKLVLFTIIVFLPFAIFYIFQFNPYNYDFFKMYGMLIGFYLGYLFEDKFVKFNLNIPLWKKIVRYVVGLILVIGVYLGLSSLFGIFAPTDEVINVLPGQVVLTDIMSLIRYCLVTFIAIGVYPWIFKKLNF